MFDPAPGPRVFGIPPGADFPAELVRGILAAHAGKPPEDLARLRLIVNTRRMERRITELFAAGPARLLPRISLVTDPLGAVMLPPAVSPLRQRLAISTLVAGLLERSPDLAPRAALFDLADSLSALLEEMDSEGVPPEAVMALDVSQHSAHWERAQRFIGIVRQYLDHLEGGASAQARARIAVQALAAQWEDTPPEGPVIVAGSTGSRGTTMLLMAAVARLPQGAIVLPGYDFDMPAEAWTDLDEALSAEDHPQFRFRALMRALGITPGDVRPFAGAMPPCPARNRLVSLALRPAPVTDRWLAEGPALGDLSPAFDAVTLVEAPSQRDEALAIALRLRQAAEDGKTAALITPDRMLTRQVTAALARWDILPDDSAGTPLQLTPPGRFLRHVAEALHRDCDAEMVMTILNHPLCHSATGRGAHLLFTRELGLFLRKNGLPFPDRSDLETFAAKLGQPAAMIWARWVADCLTGPRADATAPLGAQVARHLALAERLAQGPDGQGSGVLWDEKAGRKAKETMAALVAEADFGADLGPRDYADLVGAILAREEVRDRDGPHPGILIWGTLEARVQGADLLILGGLNEGSWPEMPPPDPWLNRKMRHDAGLLLPERRIGLSAHDFQQAIAAPEVWLTRALRSDDAQTVSSRWLNRITNLMYGLPAQNGPQALEQARARGRHWLALASVLEAPGWAAPAPRPAPRPPVAARPRELSVTAIQRLVRDPYAIYAAKVLRLKPLDPLMRPPDALLRGIATHHVLEKFIRGTCDHPEMLSRAALEEISGSVLAQKVPWPEVRLLWQARLARVADWFIATERQRQARARPLGFEREGRATIPALGFTLKGTADRIDCDAEGRLVIYDYKTGKPPGKDEQIHFDRQLMLEAAMAEQGAFEDIPAAEVAAAVYIGLGGAPEEVEAPFGDLSISQVWAELETLIAAYLDPAQGYLSRRAVQREDARGNYDQLARFGEWDITDAPVPEDLT